MTGTPEWQDLATAPKDRLILLDLDTHADVGQWFEAKEGGGFWCCHAQKVSPLGWSPIPKRRKDAPLNREALVSRLRTEAQSAIDRASVTALVSVEDLLDILSAVPTTPTRWLFPAYLRAALPGFSWARGPNRKFNVSVNRDHILFSGRVIQEETGKEFAAGQTRAHSRSEDEFERTVFHVLDYLDKVQ
jgi:hypothetical protein